MNKIIRYILELCEEFAPLRLELRRVPVRNKRPWEHNTRKSN